MTDDVVTVVQARLGSTRLPGKVLLPLDGEPALSRMLYRLFASRLAGRLVVATTWLSEDDAIETLCAEIGVDCFRGHPTDLLDRHHRAVEETGATLVVKVPSDCPLIDPRVVDRVIAAALSDPSADYVSNLHPPTYPDGNDVEVMTRKALAVAFREAKRQLEREHTTPFLWDQPERFRVVNVRWGTGRDLSRSHRFTLDYAEDYQLIRAVFEALHPRDPLFTVEDVVELVDRSPELLDINRSYWGHSWHLRHLAELRTLGGGPP